jgi:hypothetical protein
MMTTTMIVVVVVVVVVVVILNIFLIHILLRLTRLTTEFEQNSLLFIDVLNEILSQKAEEVGDLLLDLSVESYKPFDRTVLEHSVQ